MEEEFHCSSIISTLLRVKEGASWLLGASLPGNWLHRKPARDQLRLSWTSNRHPAALNPGPFPLDDQNFHNCWETLSEAPTVPEPPGHSRNFSLKICPARKH